MSFDQFYKICASVFFFLDLIVGAFGTGKVAVYRYVVDGLQICFFYYNILTSGVGEGNGTPLQYSCLEKPHGQRSLVGCSPWGH